MKDQEILGEDLIPGNQILSEDFLILHWEDTSD